MFVCTCKSQRLHECSTTADRNEAQGRSLSSLPLRLTGSAVEQQLLDKQTIQYQGKCRMMNSNLASHSVSGGARLTLRHVAII